MDQRLSQNQSQKQILSPQMRQYLRLLQMPVLELSQAVQVELQENPMLEESSASKKEEPVQGDAPPPAKDKPAEELRLGDTFENYEKLDETFRGSDIYGDFAGVDRRDAQKRRNFKETLITRPETLYDFLRWQVRFLEITPDEEKIAEEIIGDINDDGYLTASPEDIAKATSSQVAQVEKVLRLVHELDPPGVGARNLQECLIIQLKKKGPEAELAQTIVRDHLGLLEKRNWPQIVKVLSAGQEDVDKAVELISSLDPKPGRNFNVEQNIAVVPDATIYHNENGKLKIDIHDEKIPELRLNSYYRRLIRSKTTDKEAKAFLREKMQRAVNFLKAIKLRKSTLRMITEEILKMQPEFFEKGFSHLVPLRLKDIAANVGIHESTVSRAIQGKYVVTPQGTLPYKSFFSTKLETTSGESESQKSIMEKIKKLVDEESPKKPLSDQALVKILKNEGIVIARRTVAKYRDLLKILPSHLRRQR